MPFTPHFVSARPFSFCLNFQGTTQDVLSSLTLSFSAPVQLIGYTPGFVNNADDTADQWITTFSQGGNSSVETNWVDEQPTTFANQILVIANTALNLVTDFNGQSDGGTLQIRTLTVETDVQSVPEPLTMLGASAAVAFGAAFKRKQKG